MGMVEKPYSSNEMDDDIIDRYYELLDVVKEIKSNESPHKIALRYLQEAVDLHKHWQD